MYFRRRSPALAGVWTTADAAVTAGLLAALAGDDNAAAVAMLPQAAWLTVATPAALYQAASNPDPVVPGLAEALAR